VQAPVLLVAGADSSVFEAVGLTVDGGNLHLPFPNSRTAVIENSGHMVHFDAPGPLARAIEGFLRHTL
jgi:pimeloyl-ACP methyl ester carboxylesterase